jgi:hypothetical protein
MAARGAAAMILWSDRLGLNLTIKGKEFIATTDIFLSIETDQYNDYSLFVG